MSYAFNNFNLIRERGSRHPLSISFQSSSMFAVPYEENGSKGASVHELTDLVLSIANILTNESKGSLATTVYYILVHSYIINQ